MIVGAVLCGGASRRMGRDKALVEVDGVALARRVADALRDGGCDRILAIGGDGPALATLGLEPVADRWPGEGPLGGLATALGTAAGGDGLVLAPCDWLAPSPEVVRALLAALDRPGVEAVPVRVDDRTQWLPSAWRVDPARAATVAARVDGGARRLDAVAGVVVPAAPVAVAAEVVADADTPEDLP